MISHYLRSQSWKIQIFKAEIDITEFYELTEESMDFLLKEII